MTPNDPALQPAASHYRIPELLQDIRLLDLLELSGTTVQASRLLQLSQPTVSRRYRALAQDFGLEHQPRQRQRCRYGSTDVIRDLRLACRAHRLGAGVARIGADLMHRPLLAEVEGLLPVPMRFRAIEDWIELVREGVLDGALVSGLDLRAAPRLDTTGLQRVALGTLPLALGISPDLASQPRDGFPPVLMPHRVLAPGLNRTLLALGLTLRCLGDGDEDHWLQRLAAAPLAIPLYATAAPMVGGAPLVIRPIPGAPEAPIILLLPEATPAERLFQVAERLRSHPAWQGKGA